MENLIRHYRKLRGLTQTELAARLGTTTQSVSRLETGVMTLSTDWLERLGSALRIHPIALLPQPDAHGAQSYTLNGTEPIQHAMPEPLIWSHGAAHPVGLRLTTDCGPYRSGSLLIGDKLPMNRLDLALNRDCILGFGCGGIGLHRVLKLSSPPLLIDFIGLSPGTGAVHNIHALWVAPVCAELRIFE